MQIESTAESLDFPSATSSHDVLSGILRDGSQRLLTHAIGAEVADFIDSRTHLRNAAGHRVVVRNGSWPARSIVTGVGADPGQAAARARSKALRRGGEVHLEDSAAVLAQDQGHRGVDPPAVSQGRASPPTTSPKPWRRWGGGDAGGLSPRTITRLVESWQAEHQTWSTHALQDKQDVYLWADGVYFTIRLQEDRQCILVLMGATPEGKKELIALLDGHRESEESWRTRLLDAKSRGMRIDPKLAIDDGTPGFWKALPQVYPTTRVRM